MKPTLCEQCLIYPSCTKSCIPHAHESNSLRHQIKRMKRFIYSKNNLPRQHMKEQHRKHYNTLIAKANKNMEQGDVIRRRHDRKHYPDGEPFEGFFSGQMSSVDSFESGNVLAMEIDRQIIEEVIETANKEDQQRKERK